MSEKQPLAKWRGAPPSFSPNSEYDSLGEVTMTMPVEMAAFWMGVMGPLPGEFTLPGGRKLDTFSIYYQLVVGNKGVIPKDVLAKLDEIRKLGNALSDAGKEALAKLESTYKGQS